MGVTESAFQKKVLKLFHNPKIYVFNVVGSAEQASGTPDILACVNGHFIAVELKRPTYSGYGVTEQQKCRIRDINRAGGIAIVSHDYNEIKELIDECLLH